MGYLTMETSHQKSPKPKGQDDDDDVVVFCRQE